MEGGDTFFDCQRTTEIWPMAAISRPVELPINLPTRLSARRAGTPDRSELTGAESCTFQWSNKVVNGALQLLNIHGFGQISRRPFFQAFAAHVDRRIGCNHDYFCGRTASFDLAQKDYAIYRKHLDIKYCQLENPLFQQCECIVAVFRGLNLITLFAENSF